MGANKSCSYSDQIDPANSVITTMERAVSESNASGETKSSSPKQHSSENYSEPEVQDQLQKMLENQSEESLLQVLNSLTQTRKRIERDKEKEQELLVSLIRKYEEIYSYGKLTHTNGSVDNLVLNQLQAETGIQPSFISEKKVSKKREDRLSELPVIISDQPVRQPRERRTSEINLFRRKSMDKWSAMEISRYQQQLVKEMNRQDPTSPRIIETHFDLDASPGQTRTRTPSPATTVNTIATESPDRQVENGRDSFDTLDASAILPANVIEDSI